MNIIKLEKIVKLTVICSSLFLLGCADTAPVIKTMDRIVEVPVTVPCKIKSVSKPLMPLDDISAGDDILSNTQRALAEIERRIAYEKELEAAIKECQ